MDTVQADDEIVTWDMPETVEKGAFCTISGDIPTDGCPRGTGYYKVGVQRRCMYGHPCNRSRRLTQKQKR